MSDDRPPASHLSSRDSDSPVSVAVTTLLIVLVAACFFLASALFYSFAPI